MSDSGEWVTGDIWVPDGAKIAPSRETPGLNRALLFVPGEKGTAGPPEFRVHAPTTNASPVAPELPGGDAMKYILVAAVALAVGVVTTVVVIKHGSKIKAWWNDKALPRIVAGLSWFADIDLDQFIDTETEVAAIGPVPTAEFSAEVGIVVDDLREDMTSAEAQQRLLLVFMAAAIISEQMRKLGNARIKDDDLQALRAAMSKLTSGQVVDDLNEILKSGQLVLDGDTQAIFVQVFRGGRFADGLYQPVSVAHVEEALRLTGGGRSLEAPKADGDDDDEPGSVLAPV